MIKKLLTQQGATVETADNGQLAIEQALKSEFDLILMDIQMPILDGYEATKILCKKAYDRPIIALTARPMPEDIDKAYAAGFTELLTKPIDHEKLFETILKYKRFEVSST